MAFVASLYLVYQLLVAWFPTIWSLLFSYPFFLCLCCICCSIVVLFSFIFALCPFIALHAKCMYMCIAVKSSAYALKVQNHMFKLFFYVVACCVHTDCILYCGHHLFRWYYMPCKYTYCAIYTQIFWSITLLHPRHNIAYLVGVLFSTITTKFLKHFWSNSLSFNCC